MLENNIHAATQTIMITSQPIEGNKSFGKKSSESKEGQSRDQKRSPNQSQKKRELPQLNSLNVSYERLFPIIHDFLEFKWPAPILTDSSQRNKSLQCNYHRYHGYETKNCRSQKFLVEKLIKARHFKRYIKEPDHEVELG